MPVSYYGERGRATKLQFPFDQTTAAYPQETVIKYAHLRLENGPKHPNPTWRLAMTIEISGAGNDEDKETLYPTINLHTEDETAAQLRAVESIESLIANAQQLGTKYQTMRWARDAEGNLIIEDSQGQGA